ncbi:MAG: hypothetical protein IKN57_08010 [Parasporobacterium sp.]|nr:hypothetical protein [Parasporobacterium sp.]
MKKNMRSEENSLKKRKIFRLSDHLAHILIFSGAFILTAVSAVTAQGSISYASALVYGSDGQKGKSICQENYISGIRGSLLLHAQNSSQAPNVEKSADKYYEEALLAWIDGDYEKALELFKKLGNYKQSREYADYLTAFLLEGGDADDIAEAMRLYGSLGDFKDSKERLLMLQGKNSGGNTGITDRNTAREENPFRSAQIGDLVRFGKYEQDGDTSNGPEEIEWLVIDKDPDRALVISEYGLDARAYNLDTYTWAECSLRTWLNEEFYRSAFTEEEQGLISLTHLVNEDNPDFGTYGGRDTDDNVFLLSFEEVLEYFTDEDIACYATQAARDNGCYVDEELDNMCPWWIRTPGKPGYAAFLLWDIPFMEGMGVYFNSITVRPAMYIRKDQQPDDPFSGAAVGDILEFGRYEQDGNRQNGPEAVKWRVLEAGTQKVLVVSEYGLDAKSYNDIPKTCTWEKCSLRAWLNKDFYRNAFSKKEQGMINYTDLVNDDNPEYGTDGGNGTKDKVFLLSIDEADRYFASYEDLICFPTQAAEENGAYVDDDYWSSVWWLRSPGDDSGFAATVDLDGYIFNAGFESFMEEIVVRPALYVRLD